MGFMKRKSKKPQKQKQAGNKRMELSFNRGDQSVSGQSSRSLGNRSKAPRVKDCCDQSISGRSIWSAISTTRSVVSTKSAKSTLSRASLVSFLRTKRRGTRLRGIKCNATDDLIMKDREQYDDCGDRSNNDLVVDIDDVVDNMLDKYHTPEPKNTTPCGNVFGCGEDSLIANCNACIGQFQEEYRLNEVLDERELTMARNDDRNDFETNKPSGGCRREENRDLAVCFLDKK
jgi:hypothetical protein